MTDIQQAELKYKRAAENLADEVAAAFPIGSLVRVARGTGYMNGIVFCTPHWWADPIRIGVESLRGGTRRWVSSKDCTVDKS
jgi:hypothetical protein